jgi:hypothetical protein
MGWGTKAAGWGGDEKMNLSLCSSLVCYTVLNSIAIR